MKQIVKDDIILTFYKGLKPEFRVRVASRHGHITMPKLLQSIGATLKSRWTVHGEVKPSRFATEEKKNG